MSLKLDTGWCLYSRWRTLMPPGFKRFSLQPLQPSINSSIQGRELVLSVPQIFKMTVKNCKHVENHRLSERGRMSIFEGENI